MAARHRPRRIAATALVVLGTFAVLVGGVLLYARQEVVNPHAFAAHSSHALKDENVRAAIGDAVLDQVTRSGAADLLSFRPALESVLDGVIGSPQFRAVFRKAAVHAHDLLFKRDRGNVILDLADAGLAVSGAAKAVAPDLAKHIPKDIKPGLLSLTNRDWATDLLDAADKIRFLGIVLPILGLLCLAGAVVASPDRRLTVIRIGGAPRSRSRPPSPGPTASTTPSPRCSSSWSGRPPPRAKPGASAPSAVRSSSPRPCRSRSWRWRSCSSPGVAARPRPRATGTRRP